VLKTLGQLVERFVGHRATDTVMIELKLKDGKVYNGLVVAVVKTKPSGTVFIVAEE
jgi:hypothetical protein